MGIVQGAVTYEFFGEDFSVQRVLMSLDTACNPQAIAGFLGAVADPWLRGRAKDRFNSEGDDVTGAWAPLAGATQEIRSSMGYGAAHPINVRTGELEAYITGSPHDINIGIGVTTLTMPGAPPTPGTLAESVEQAQKGMGRGPARPVMGMNMQDTAFVLDALSGFFVKAIAL